MTLLDLEKKLNLGSPKASPQLKKVMQDCKGMTFDQFWQYIPMPISQVTGKPVSHIFPYQERILQALEAFRYGK